MGYGKTSGNFSLPTREREREYSVSASRILRKKEKKIISRVVHKLNRAITLTRYQYFYLVIFLFYSRDCIYTIVYLTCTQKNNTLVSKVFNIIACDKGMLILLLVKLLEVKLGNFKTTEKVNTAPCYYYHYHHHHHH